MKEEKFQKYQLILQAITALGTLGLAISILVSLYGIRQEHEWNRRKHTVEIIGGFEDHVAKYRPVLTNSFRALYEGNKRGKLDSDTAKRIWKLEVQQDSEFEFMKDQEKIKEVRGQLIGLFNYMEFLVLSYNENVVDQDSFKKSLADPIIHYHTYLEEFINASQSPEILGYRNWQPVSDFVTDIKKERMKSSSNTKEPTGK